MCSPEHKDQIVDNQEQAPHIHEDVQGKKLLQLARSTIENYLRDGNKLAVKTGSPSIPHTTGLFVTLWGQGAAEKGQSFSENSVLRGCIGQLQSDLPLYELVQEVSISAATRDPRFSPLTPAELEIIRIEIALLSPLRQIHDLQQITIGQDGLILEGLGKRGLLLPKVALRMRWDRKSFLKGVCHKAGLPLGCWPGACNLYAFTTQVFDEAANESQEI